MSQCARCHTNTNGAPYCDWCAAIRIIEGKAPDAS